MRGGPLERLSSSRALLGGPALAFAFGLLVAGWVLFFANGLDYYRTPLRVRGYHSAHRTLRPSAPVGHSLGIAGSVTLLCTLGYVARKRMKFLSKRGSVPRWLEVHVFFGVFGPILITLHTSLKFNGIISVAYWSMILVMLSGFVGRSLYIRIPKTIRGHELTRKEIEQRVAELKSRLDDPDVPSALHERLDRLDHSSGSAWQRWREESRLRSSMSAAGVDPALVQEALALARERTSLMRTIARLEKRRHLFQIWHVFHRPLVWVMFAILLVHVTVALYFGYTMFG